MILVVLMLLCAAGASGIFWHLVTHPASHFTLGHQVYTSSELFIIAAILTVLTVSFFFLALASKLWKIGIFVAGFALLSSSGFRWFH